MAGFGLLSRYDHPDLTVFSVMRDFYGMAEFLRFIGENFIEPYITDPIVSAVEDAMFNIVGVTGNKNFSTQWADTLKRHTERYEARKARDEGREAPSKAVDTSKPVKQGDAWEMSGTVAYKNLQRVVAQLSPALGRMHKEVDSEFTQEQYVQALTEHSKQFLPEPFRKTQNTPAPDGFELRDHLMEDASNISRDTPKDDSEYTVWGDKKISPDALKTEEDYSRQGKEKLLQAEEAGSDKIWNSPEEYSYHLLQEKLKAAGIGSVEDLMALQEQQRELDEKLMGIMISELTAQINKNRAVQGIRLIAEIECPRPGDDEFEAWKLRYAERED